MKLRTRPGSRHVALAVVLSTACVLRFLDAADLLHPDELSRADCLARDTDRDDFLAAHALARACVAAAVGGPPSRNAVIQVCARCGGPHGRPQVVVDADLHVSWSHAAGTVAVAVAPAACGVDLEAIYRPTAQELVRISLTPAERCAVSTATDPDQAVMRLWLRKECLVKAGEGSLDAMLATDVSTATADGVLKVRHADGRSSRYLVAERQHESTLVTVAAAAPITEVQWLVVHRGTDSQLTTQRALSSS